MCRWCAEGEYRDIVKPPDPNVQWAGRRPDSVRQYGLTETAGNEWRWLHCGSYGHVEIFLHRER